MSISLPHENATNMEHGYANVQKYSDDNESVSNSDLQFVTDTVAFWTIWTRYHATLNHSYRDISGFPKLKINSIMQQVCLRHVLNISRMIANWFEGLKVGLCHCLTLPLMIVQQEETIIWATELQIPHSVKITVKNCNIQNQRGYCTRQAFFHFRWKSSWKHVSPLQSQWLTPKTYYEQSRFFVESVEICFLVNTF